VSGVVFATTRLILRRWKAADRAPYAAMMADPEVGYWLGATLSAADAEAQIDRFIAAEGEREPGFLAVERAADATFLGAACLRAVAWEDHPMGGTVEVGWRLARAFWGAGYATEATAALVGHAFDALGLDEIVSFTATGNYRSRRVMERLGFTPWPERDFEHPALEPGHPLRRHVVYQLCRGGMG
jgi:RimJ/RimL family protein N-acetyltransferase